MLLKRMFVKKKTQALKDAAKLANQSVDTAEIEDETKALDEQIKAMVTKSIVTMSSHQFSY